MSRVLTGREFIEVEVAGTFVKAADVSRPHGARVHRGLAKGGKPGKVETVALQDFIWLRSENDGFWYPAIEVGDDVKKDQVLGKITDVWGNTLQTVKATATGRVLFLVSSLAINNGDPLLAIGA